MTEHEVREALRSVEDPEAGMSIVDLGLIYAIDAQPDRALYAPLALLHASLALRVTGAVAPGAWGNAAAIALFIATAATLTLRDRARRGARPPVDQRQDEARARG